MKTKDAVTDSFLEQLEFREKLKEIMDTARKERQQSEKSDSNTKD